MEKREGQAHCGHCKTYKSLEEFAPSQRHNGGWCRSCHKAKYREVRPALPPKSCEVCEKQIDEPRPETRFCSKACKAKAHYWRVNPPEQRACESCGADISAMRRNAKYCSDACQMRDRLATGRITPEKRRQTRMLAQYGITAEDYERMLVSQCGVCWICGTDPGEKPLRVDHCHDKGHVRGLLCDNCNLALGLFKDNPDLLRRAADYLEAPAS
jgi:hypothetical protein